MIDRLQFSHTTLPHQLYNKLRDLSPGFIPSLLQNANMNGTFQDCSEDEIRHVCRSGMRGTITWIHGIILTLLLSLCCSKIGQKQVKKVSFSPQRTYIKEVTSLLFLGGYSLSSNPKGLTNILLPARIPPSATPHLHGISVSFKVEFEPISPADFTDHCRSHSSPFLRVATIFTGERVTK